MDVRSVSSTPASRPMASPLPEEAAVPDGSSRTDSAGKAATGTAGYISPYLRYDQGARVAVLLFRDVDTGETQDQIPSQRVVEEYRRAAGRLPQGTEKDEAASAGTPQPTRAGTSAPAANGNGAGRGVSFASGGTGAPAAAPSLGFATASAPAATAASPPPPVAAGGSGGGTPGGLVSVTV